MAEELSGQAQQLASAIGFFKVAEGEGASLKALPAKPSAAAPRVSLAAPAPAPRIVENQRRTAIAVARHEVAKDGEFEEF